MCLSQPKDKPAETPAPPPPPAAQEKVQTPIIGEGSKEDKALGVGRKGKKSLRINLAEKGSGLTIPSSY
jgi:hypothetical protein